MGIDAGPCAEVICEGMQVCHGPSGTCVDCVSGDDCGAAAPICDQAFGTCVIFQAGLTCAPCNTDLDCPNAGEVCSDFKAAERVCLAPCTDGACPDAFVCNEDTSLCEPALGTCTQLRKAIQRAPCAADTDCVPLGAAAAPGTCNTTSMQCQAACDVGFACPTGFTCVGDPGFCQ
jgi:hypothetical protein